VVKRVFDGLRGGIQAFLEFLCLERESWNYKEKEKKKGEEKWFFFANFFLNSC
jgi:hypothetical protein